MGSIAETIGWIVMAAMAFGAITFALALIWAYFPARFDLHRDLPSQLLTPHGRYNLTLLVGVSSRRKARWHFGFMLLEPGFEQKVTAKKTAKDSHND